MQELQWTIKSHEVGDDGKSLDVDVALVEGESLISRIDVTAAGAAFIECVTGAGRYLLPKTMMRPFSDVVNGTGLIKTRSLVGALTRAVRNAEVASLRITLTQPFDAKEGVGLLHLAIFAPKGKRRSAKDVDPAVDRTATPRNGLPIYSEGMSELLADKMVGPAKRIERASTLAVPVTVKETGTKSESEMGMKRKTEIPRCSTGPSVVSLPVRAPSASGMDVAAEVTKLLPPFLAGTRIGVAGEASLDQQRLVRRYVTAYGGVFLPDWMKGKLVTHVLVFEGVTKDEVRGAARSLYGEATANIAVLSPDWLFSCHSQQKLLPVNT